MSFSFPSFMSKENTTIRKPSKAVGTLREALTIFWAAADDYAKRRLFLAIVLVAVGALLAAFTPIVLKLVVDSLTNADLSDGDHLAPLLLVVMYVSGQFVNRCVTELRVMLHGHAGQRVRRHIARRLFDHIIRLPLRFQLERKAGAMGETAEQGLRGIDLILEHLVYTVVPVTIEFSVVALILVHFDHGVYLTILGIASIGYIAAFRWGASSIRAPSETVSRSHIDAHALMTDFLVNGETVKYYDAEDVVGGRYDAALGRTETAWNRFFTSYAASGLLVASIFALSLGVSLILAAGEVSRGVMTVGDFVLVNAYVMRLVQPLEMLGFAIRDIAQGLAFLQTLLQLLREKTEDCQGWIPSCAGPPRGELKFDNISFSYHEPRVVLRNISFTVSAGKTVAIVGVSGSGKSSLTRLLFRLYEPDSGQILLDGHPIKGLPLSYLRQAIAVVPQDTVLFHDSIANNIGFGRHGSSLRDIEGAARVAHLHEAIVRMPNGYETLVGDRGLKLSGGERQRVAIARAALKSPRVFVFDEATSSLDSMTERAILRNLVDVSVSRTTFIIAHRLSTVVHADEILVLDRGMIIERGTHEQLRSINGRYAAMWDAQQSESQRFSDERASTA